MKTIEITDSWRELKLKIGECVQLYGRVWKYGEERKQDGTVICRFLEPVFGISRKVEA